MNIIQRFETAIPSRPWRIVLITILTLILLLAVFHIGMMAGYRKAAFSYRWGENYHKNFGGPRMGFMAGWSKRGFDNRDFMEASGIVGQVIKIDIPQIVIKGRGDTERIIIIRDDTVIKRMRETVKPQDIRANDMVIAIGDPNEAGQTVAKLIRLLPPPPLGTGSGMMLKTPLSQPYFRPF